MTDLHKTGPSGGIEALKRAAGNRAAEFVVSGTAIGLGSGSTARYGTLRIAERLREGSLRDVVAVPTSDGTERLARQEGIPSPRWPSTRSSTSPSTAPMRWTPT